MCKYYDDDADDEDDDDNDDDGDDDHHQFLDPIPISVYRPRGCPEPVPSTPLCSARAGQTP